MISCKPDIDDEEERREMKVKRGVERNKKREEMAGMESRCESRS